MGLLAPAVFEQLNKLKGLLGETPIGRYVRGQDQGVTVNGLLGTMRAMPVFDQQAAMGDMRYAADAIGPGAIGMVGHVKKIPPAADRLGRQLDRSGLSEWDRNERTIRSAVDEFTAQVLEQKDAPKTVLEGARLWAADAGLSEGAIRRALYSKWNSSDSKRLRELAPFMLSGGGP